MLFSLSALYLGWIIYWSLIRKNVPRWLYRFHYAGHNHAAVNESKQKSILVQACHLGLILLLYVALYYFFSPFFINNAWTWGLATIGFLALVRPLRNNFLKASTPDFITTMSEEAKEDPMESPDSTDWATREQIQNSIPYAANNGVPVGIHIGEGFHWYDNGHMLTVGSFRQGKDVTLILPALLPDGPAVSRSSGYQSQYKDFIGAARARPGGPVRFCKETP